MAGYRDAAGVQSIINFPCPLVKACDRLRVGDENLANHHCPYVWSIISLGLDTIHSTQSPSYSFPTFTTSLSGPQDARLTLSFTDDTRTKLRAVVNTTTDGPAANGTYTFSRRTGVLPSDVVTGSYATPFPFPFP